MPQEVLRGKAILHGVRNNGSAIDIEYEAFIESAKIQHKWDQEVVKDEQGYDAAWAATNERYEADITLIPKGSTRAAVEAATIILDPYQQVTFANFSVSVYNGGWGYNGDQQIELNAGKPGKVQLKFIRYVNTDQNTAFATEITG